MSYTGSVELISGITPKNGQSFPLVNAPDVYIDDTHRLPDALSDIHDNIDDNISDLKNDLSVYDDQLNGTDGAYYDLRNGSIGADGTWGSPETAKHVVIPIKPGQTIQIKANADRQAIFAVLTDDKVLIGRPAYFSTDPDFTQRLTCQAGTLSPVYTAPSDAKYLYITAIATSTINFSPVNVLIDGIERNDNIRKHIADIEDKITEINQDADNSVRVDVIQSHSDAQKKTARNNIDAPSTQDISDIITDYDNQINGTNGAFYNLRAGAIAADGTWGSQETAKHVVIPINPGQTIQIKANASRQTIFAVLTDDKVLFGRSASFSSATGFTQRITCAAGTLSPVYTAPEDAKYLYVTAIATSTVNFFPNSIMIDAIERNDNVRKHIADIEDEITTTNNKISQITPSRIDLKVGTFNVGMFNYGRNTSSHARLYTDEKIDALKEFIANGEFDILACQEATDINDQIYLGYFTQIYKRNMLNIVSKYPLKNQTNGEFIAKYNDNTRYWIKAEIEVNGINITLLNCHLSWQEEATNVRAQQHQEIMDLLSSTTYAIIFGDFNAYNISEFDDFIAANYVIANGGYLRAKNTGPALLPEKPMDNILLKGPTLVRLKATRKIGQIIEITPETPDVTADEFDTYLSDHLPVSGEVIIRY